MAELTPDCINLNISGNSAYSVLKNLADMAEKRGFVSDRGAFLHTLLLREKLHSTGFGAGIAVPHGKSPCVKQPFILFARKADGVEWKASDDEAVNCWICIGVPQAGEDEQVKMIGTLCRRLIHADFVSQLKQGDMSQILTLLNHTLTQ